MFQSRKRKHVFEHDVNRGTMQNRTDANKFRWTSNKARRIFANWGASSPLASCLAESFTVRVTLGPIRQLSLGGERDSCDSSAANKLVALSQVRKHNGIQVRVPSVLPDFEGRRSVTNLSSASAFNIWSRSRARACVCV